MLETVHFTMGETKRVCIKVTSGYNHPFEISRAQFSLMACNEVEEKGDCEISQIKDNECILSVIINPKRKNATYTLRYTYDIAPEKLIYDVRIRVS